MGIRYSHGIDYSNYSTLHRARYQLAEAAGMGDLSDYEGYGGAKPFPEDDPIVYLLEQSDDDGEILEENCGLLAERIESLLPDIEDPCWLIQELPNGLRQAHKLKQLFCWS
jgi:hypothetical protein